jgi:23S rRNA G2445 N2-methylase RlmL
MSTYSFRIVTTPGIEKVLVRELKLLGIKNVEKVKGRKIVEAKGTLKDLYRMVYK